MSPALEGLLGHDQTPAHPQRRLALPVHHLPGVLPQLVHHAEAHEGPQARGHPARLEDREDLSVPVLRLIEAEPCIGLGWVGIWIRGGRAEGWNAQRKQKGGNVYSFAGRAGQGKVDRGDVEKKKKKVLKYGDVVML